MIFEEGGMSSVEKEGEAAPNQTASAKLRKARFMSKRSSISPEKAVGRKKNKLTLATQQSGPSRNHARAGLAVGGPRPEEWFYCN